ncbi:MAG: nucleotidyltransferase domain-containing protein [Propionibacteriaceae bacterium]|nr:nucleotidyltransferase domain-containing protein [Propionibacteriaceae bacterium]
MPDAQGAVLSVFLRTSTALTGRQIHAIVSDSHSLWSTQQALKSLESFGLLNVVSVGRANLYTLNTEHYCIEPLRTLMAPVSALCQIVAETVDQTVLSVILFGSITRGQATAEADIDLAVIAPTGWAGRKPLERAVSHRLGNECDVVHLTKTDLEDPTMSIVSDILTEGIVVYGMDILHP